MNLDDLWRIVIRRGWIPLVMAFVGGIAGYVVARMQSPVYDAEARVSIVAARPADLGQTQAINGLLRSFAADALTLEMAQAVGAQLDMDAGALKAWANAVSDEGTREVRIRYRSSDPVEAERVADTWAKTFVAQREQDNLELDQRERVFATQRDSTTHSQSWPRPKLLAALGAAAGFAAGVVVALLMEYGASATVRSGGDLEAVGLPSALASVPTVSTTGGARPIASRGRTARQAARIGVPVVALALVGALTALAVSASRTTEFRARTRIAVMPARTSDWGQTQAIREIMRGYSEDIATRRMAAEVSRRLQLDLPADDLLEGLAVAPNEDTYEIWLDYKSPDAQIAEQISGAWAAVFAEERSTANQDLDRVDRIYVKTRDRLPATPVAPAPAAALLAGAVIGALAGAAAVAATANRAHKTILPDATAMGLIPTSSPRGAA